jgi:hypothetical protein
MAKKLGVAPWEPIPKPPGKVIPAPQIDDGTFPIVERAGPGVLPVAWAWRSPVNPDVEAFALYRPGLPGGYQVISPSSAPVDLNLDWLGVLAFRPPDPPYPDAPWGDPAVLAEQGLFLDFIVDTWPHVITKWNLTLLLFDMSADPQGTPGGPGLFADGVYRVHQGSPAKFASAWVWHEPGGALGTHEVWVLWDPGTKYVPPGAALDPATLWFEFVPGCTPADRTAFEAWVRTEPGVALNPVLVTHDVRVRKVWP